MIEQIIIYSLYKLDLTSQNHVMEQDFRNMQTIQLYMYPAELGNWFLQSNGSA